MNLVFSINLDGKTIEIFQEEQVSVATIDGGAAPWNVGNKTRKNAYHWHVDGEYHSTFNWSNKKSMQDFYLNQFKRHI